MDRTGVYETSDVSSNLMETTNLKIKMALKIKATLLLTGESTKRFLDEIDKNRFKRVSREELDRIRENHKIMLKFEENANL